MRQRIGSWRNEVAYIRDYDGTQIGAITRLADFTNASVLDIGCGEGFLTYRYAHLPTQIEAIDTDAQRIENARANAPVEIAGKIHFQVADITGYSGNPEQTLFDLALFGWSL